MYRLYYALSARWIYMPLGQEVAQLIPPASYHWSSSGGTMYASTIWHQAKLLYLVMIIIAVNVIARGQTLCQMFGSNLYHFVPSSHSLSLSLSFRSLISSTGSWWGFSAERDCGLLWPSGQLRGEGGRQKEKVRDTFNGSYMWSKSFIHRAFFLNVGWIICTIAARAGEKKKKLYGHLGCDCTYGRLAVVVCFGAFLGGLQCRLFSLSICSPQIKQPNL